MAFLLPVYTAACNRLNNLFRETIQAMIKLNLSRATIFKRASNPTKEIINGLRNNHLSKAVARNSLRRLNY
jgi:hypothetical protein